MSSREQNSFFLLKFISNTKYLIKIISKCYTNLLLLWFKISQFCFSRNYRIAYYSIVPTQTFLQNQNRITKNIYNFVWLIGLNKENKRGWVYMLAFK